MFVSKSLSNADSHNSRTNDIHANDAISVCSWIEKYIPINENTSNTILYWLSLKTPHGSTPLWEVLSFKK